MFTVFLQYFLLYTFKDQKHSTQPRTFVASKKTNHLLSPYIHRIIKPVALILKVPKCENFNGLDCHNFYTIKPSGGARHASLNFWHILRAHIISWRVQSVHASVPYTYAQHNLKWRNIFKFDFQGTHQFLTHMLSECNSSWLVRYGMLIIFWRDCAQCKSYSSWRKCSAYASAPDP